MRINKQKHGKENTIGKIIYGFLMFMPLMAILTTCAYVIFNKNAYQSYSKENIETAYRIDSAVGLTNGIEYTFNKDTTISATSSTIIRYSSISINWVDYIPSYQAREYNGFQFYGENKIILLYYGEGDTYWYSNATINRLPETFNFTLTSHSNNNNFNGFFITQYIYENPNLANVFYYSIDKVEQSPLFSWATNTGTHNVLESTCQTLGITTTFVPMLLAYWLMMSLMYLLYDIALLIVHMAHNRIHDIESSI